MAFFAIYNVWTVHKYIVDKRCMLRNPFALPPAESEKSYCTRNYRLVCTICWCPDTARYSLLSEPHLTACCSRGKAFRVPTGFLASQEWHLQTLHFSESKKPDDSVNLLNNKHILWSSLFSTLSMVELSPDRDGAILVQNRQCEQYIAAILLF